MRMLIHEKPVPTGLFVIITYIYLYALLYIFIHCLMLANYILNDKMS